MIAKASGFAGTVGTGENRLPAVNTADAAVLYRLALEHAPAGSRLHAVAEDGVPMLEITKALSEHLQIPTQAVTSDDAETHLGFLARMVPLNNPTSAAITRELLHWKPTHPGLIEDLHDELYYANEDN